MDDSQRIAHGMEMAGLRRRLFESDISDEDLYGQLAEEACELGQAALKMQRILRGTNPTPVTRKEAYSNVVEEATDVCLMLELLLYSTYDQDILKTKIRRWCDRLDDERMPKAKNGLYRYIGPCKMELERGKEYWIRTDVGTDICRVTAYDASARWSWSDTCRGTFAFSEENFVCCMYYDLKTKDGRKRYEEDWTA